MAIYHMPVMIHGRSDGQSAISCVAYRSGEKLYDEELGLVSDFSKKQGVIFSDILLCENAPAEYHDRETLWNAVMKVEKASDAQFAREFEPALPREFDLEMQKKVLYEFFQPLVEAGMCIDLSIHDKGDGNPHCHAMATMRPILPNGKWGLKETKEWDFVRDENGDIVIDPSHPDWWQDKKDPDRHGIRIPLLDENGNRKVDSHNRKQWKRVSKDATGWNNPKNCEIWRSEWARICNQYLEPENQIDHRSYARQGILQIPQIHEGADARSIDKKYQQGRSEERSWRVIENEKIKQQNQILKRIQMAFRNAKESFRKWKERFDDFRREYGSDTHDGRDALPDRGAAAALAGNLSGDGIAAGIDSWIAGAKSKLERIGRELEQRKPAFAETERRVADIHKMREESEKLRKRSEQIITEMKQREQSTGRKSVLEKLTKKQSEIKQRKSQPQQKQHHRDYAR